MPRGRPKNTIPSAHIIVTIPEPYIEKCGEFGYSPQDLIRHLLKTMFENSPDNPVLNAFQRQIEIDKEKRNRDSQQKTAEQQTHKQYLSVIQDYCNQHNLTHEKMLDSVNGDWGTLHPLTIEAEIIQLLRDRGMSPEPNHVYEQLNKLVRQKAAPIIR
ncbi:MAG: hypothetical protein ABR999_10705 [Methanoregula sp.]|uniref:hypothetical protein n=1 Tax=Methanoregula sp. TaxID=2052170 RepID=UPI003D0B29EA